MTHHPPPSLSALVLFLIFQSAIGFSLPSRQQASTRGAALPANLTSNSDTSACSRRGALVTVFGKATTAAISFLFVPPRQASADEGKTIWITGKPPLIPGQKQKESTKKDPGFLRSIADCKNQCENTLDKDGRAKSKEDCLSECQDICCTTYEQCTFAIVPRI